MSRVGLLLVTGFASIAAVIAVDRLGKGLRTGPRDSLIATASDPADLGRNFGVHRAMDTAGALAGPLLAFAVLAAIPLGLGGYRAVFVFSAAFALLGVVVLALVVPDLRTARGKADAGDQTPRRRIALRLSDLSQPALRRVLLVAGLLGLVTVGDGFIYLSLSESGSLTAKYFPLLFVGTSAAYMVLAIPMGRLADRVGRGRVFLAGHALLLGVYLLTASRYGGALWSVVLVLLLMGSFYAATDGVLSALATQSVPEESRASGIAAAQTVVALGQVRVLDSLRLALAADRPSDGPVGYGCGACGGPSGCCRRAASDVSHELGRSGMKRARWIVIMVSAVLCLGLAGGYFVYVRAQGSSTVTGSPGSVARPGQRARRAPCRVPKQRARRSLRATGRRPAGQSRRRSRQPRPDLRTDVRDKNSRGLPVR